MAQSRLVAPTICGNALLKRGIAALDELKQSVSDIEFLADPGAGELYIGASPTQAEGFVFAVLDRLSQQYPRIAVQVVLGGMLEQCDNLRERRIDVAFVRLPGTAPPEDIDPRKRIRLVEAVASQHELSKSAEVRNQKITAISI